jgi:hypothetical protein
LTGTDFTYVQTYDLLITNLQAKAKGQCIELTWTRVGDYSVAVRSTNGPNRVFQEIGRTNSAAAAFLDCTVECDGQYYYRVYAYIYGRAEPVGVSYVVPMQGDTTPPSIECPPNIIVECSPQQGQPVFYSVSATDACDTNVTVLCTPPSGTVFSPGTTAVTCTATDAWGNRSECQFAVLLVSTNCLGAFNLFTSTCLAGVVNAQPALPAYPCGTCVQVTALAAPGWTFLGWLGHGRGTSPWTTLTMTQHKCVEAVFGTPVSAGPASHGRVWLDPEVPLHPCGTQVRALALPDAGYYFSHWTGALADTVVPAEFTVTQTNPALSAVFLPLPAGQYALSVEPQGNGRVQGQSQPLLNLYPAGAPVDLRAVPDAGQAFAGWTIVVPGGEPGVVLTDNPTTVLMNSNVQVVASFTRRPVIEVVGCEGELTAGLFRMKVHGKPQEVYAIEAAPTVDKAAAWQPVARGTNVLGAVEYEDPFLPGTSQRFYRARLEP